LLVKALQSNFNLTIGLIMKALSVVLLTLFSFTLLAETNHNIAVLNNVSEEADIVIYNDSQTAINGIYEDVSKGGYAIYSQCFEVTESNYNHACADDLMIVSEAHISLSSVTSSFQNMFCRNPNHCTVLLRQKHRNNDFDSQFEDNATRYFGPMGLSKHSVSGSILSSFSKKALDKTTKKGAKQREKKQIRDAAKAANLDPKDLPDFGYFLEFTKRKSGKPNDYQYSYKELRELAKQYVELLGKRKKRHK